MNSSSTQSWHTFLQKQGIVFSEQNCSRTSSENHLEISSNNDFICDLEEYTLIKVSGDDARTFLQNQLTNDIDALDADQHLLFGYCNPKGRLIGLFRMLRIEDGYLLQCPRDTSDLIVDRLKKYVLRAKVSFEQNIEWVSFGLVGRTLEKHLQDQFGKPAKKPDAFTLHQAVRILRHADHLDETVSVPRYQVIAPLGEAQTLWQIFSQEASVAGSCLWRRLDIAAGIPHVDSKNSEAFVPQMLNLDLINGVSFKKGCYPGQEIVARMHYLGNLKQRMFRFSLDKSSGATSIQPGDNLVNLEQQNVGTIVDVQPNETGWDMLAVVRLTALNEELFLPQDESYSLHRLPLPYTLETEPGKKAV